jgi:hypothetical protein
MFRAPAVAAVAAGASALAFASSTKRSAECQAAVHAGVVPASKKSLASNYDLMFYVKAALAGGICCGVTHAAMTVSQRARGRAEA